MLPAIAMCIVTKCRRLGWGIEKSEEFAVYTVGDSREVSWVVKEIGVVFVDDDEASGVVVEDEAFVGFVEPFQIVEMNTLLIVASTLLDVAHQMGYRGAQVYHKVGLVRQGYHELEELHVGVEVAVGHIALGVVVGGKYIDALKDGAILYDGRIGALELEHIAEALFEEIDFHRERPSSDVLVVVFEIRVVGHGLKLRCPAIMVGQHLCQCGLATAYVACYNDVHIGNKFCERCWCKVSCLARPYGYLFIRVGRQIWLRRQHLICWGGERGFTLRVFFCAVAQQIGGCYGDTTPAVLADVAEGVEGILRLAE